MKCFARLFLKSAQVINLGNPFFIVNGIVDYGVPENGPKLFYDGSKFLMRLGSPIQVTIFQNENGEGIKSIGKVELNEAANSVTGGKLTEDTYKVNIGKKHMF